MMVTVRPIAEHEQGWLRTTLIEEWGSVDVVSRGQRHNAAELPGFIAEIEGDRVGVVTYRVDGAACEVVTLNSFQEQQGAGTALLEAVQQAARMAGCRRLWLITTNDNTPAIRFYQRRGWDLTALHRHAVAEARRLKPDIPELGRDGIPLHHELEFTLDLAPAGETG